MSGCKEVEVEHGADDVALNSGTVKGCLVDDAFCEERMDFSWYSL